MSIPVKSAWTGNIYLWNKVVAESGCWPESYYIDLTNSSSQAVIDAWWLLAWNPAFWPDWMYRASWENAHIYKEIDLTKYNKLKMITNFYLYAWWRRCSVTTWIHDSTKRHIRWPRHESYWTYSAYRAIMFDYIWDNPIAKSSYQISSAWWYKTTFEFDLKSWLTTCQLEWTLSDSLTYTLDSSQLSNVLSYNMLWWICHCDSWHKIKDILIELE
jgi:hypothetical protein